MKKKNDGTKSQDIFVEKMEGFFGAKNVFIYRLTDTKEIRGAIKASGGVAKGFAKATPSDFLVTVAGRMGYAEVKSTQNEHSFGFSCFTPGQWAGMKRQVAARGSYNVYVHRLNTDQWYVVSGEAILVSVNLGKKSLKWEDMETWD